ncbi:hypothetical protein EYF80_066598 [Liparis tanakae]|uniref:Uncharacterized protein n=1 Tax=Liparis tanakae TaxID=230148 RepID=A0A4Z2E3J2_9TELE|nr:hypothetical protein EYF80_066598 [Liparis tanakae]
MMRSGESLHPWGLCESSRTKGPSRSISERSSEFPRSPGPPPRSTFCVGSLTEAVRHAGSNQPGPPESSSCPRTTENDNNE